MSLRVEITGSGGHAKVRSHVWVGVWSLVTVVFYPWYWYYSINRELRDLGRARNAPQLGDNPAVSLVAVTFGALLLLIPSFISIYRTGKRIQEAQDLVGQPQHMNGWLAFALFAVFDFYYVLLPVPGPLCSAFFQDALNSIWRTPGVATHPDGEPVAAPKATIASPSSPSAPPPGSSS
jgi:hypothetical protein